MPSSRSSKRPSRTGTERPAPSASGTRRVEATASAAARGASALRRESDRALLDLIRRLRALPMEQRTHFLRQRLPGGGTSL